MAIGLCQAKRIVRLRKSSETSEVLAFDCWRHSSTIFPGPLSECSRMDSMSSSQSVEEVERRSIPRLRIAFGLIVLSGVAMLCVLCQQFQGSVERQEALARLSQATSVGSVSQTRRSRVMALPTPAARAGVTFVGSGPVALAFDALRARLWVANSHDNTVQSIDTTTGDVSRSIPVGANPRALAFDALRARLWVANRDDSTVQAIHVVTAQTEPPIPVRPYPFALAFDGTRLWVANEGDGSVQSIDPVTGEIGQTIAVGSSPRALAFDALRGRLWVANARSNSVQAIQVGTDEVSPPISVGEFPVALAFDGVRLWAANFFDNTV